MDKNLLVISLLGKSGSGKGTQVNLLKEKYNLERIGSGDLLRERKKTQDFTGAKISTVVDTGGIIPTPVVFKLWMEKLENYKLQGDLKGLIFDGSPRKIREAYLLDEALEWYEWEKNTKMILLDISDEEVMRRVALRKICSNSVCGFIPSAEQAKELEKCPACGANLIIRPEDSPENTEKRLAWFREEVEPVINYYKEKNELLIINGEQSVEKVFEDIVKAIEG